MAKANLVNPEERGGRGAQLSGAPPSSGGGASLTTPPTAEIAAAVTAHTAAGDPHTAYALDSDLTTHSAAADPHTGYQKESEKGAASGYASLDGTTKVPLAQVPTGSTGSTVALGNHAHAGVYDPAGAVTTHEAAADPHPAYLDGNDLTSHTNAADPHTVYQRESEKAAASGYASLDSGTKVPAAQLGTGTADATTFLRGDRSWATPPAGGGSSPNPGSGTAASAVGDTTFQGSSPDYSRTDHRHQREAFGAVTAGATFGLSPANGAATTVARSDHAHGTPTDPITAHEAAADPHAGYQKESEKAAASGYPSLDAGTHVPVAQLGSGTPSTSTYLRGDGAWTVVPGGAVAGASTTSSAVADTTAQGTSPDFSRTDHRHGREAFGAVAAETAFGSASTNGVATTVSRSDHKHGNPSYTDPVPAHVALGDPHTQYQQESQREVASGYAGLDGDGFLLEPWRKAAAYPTVRNPDATVRYAKVLSGTFDSQFELTAGLMSVCLTDYNRANTSSAARFGIVRWDFTQVLAMGSQPYVVLEQIGGGTLDANDLILVVSGTGPTTWELYLRLSSQGQMGWVSPLNMGVNQYNTWSLMPVTWSELDALVTALPAGQQYPLVSTSTPGWVNVRDFGALGNGIADDTVAFQNAIIAAEATSSVVFVPFSTQPYCISQTLFLDAYGVRMIGAGKGYAVSLGNFQRVSELKWIGAGSGPVIHVIHSDGLSRIGGNAILDIAIDGNDTAMPCVQISGGWGGKYDVLVRNSGPGSLLGAFYMVATNSADCANNDVDLVLGYGNNGPGLKMHASPNSARNTCLNRIHSVWGFYGHDNAATNHGVVVGGTDHNTIEWMWLFHETLGTDDVVGSTATQFELLFLSHATAGSHARKNVVRFCGGGAGRDDPNIWFQGTAQGANPSRENIVEWIDMQGRAANPVVGAGSVDNRWFGDSKFWNLQASGGM